jgi:hypothetical protein
MYFYFYNSYIWLKENLKSLNLGILKDIKVGCLIRKKIKSIDYPTLREI